LLDLSRIDAVRMTLHPEPVELYLFVKNILAQFEGVRQATFGKLLFEFKLDRELRVMLDPDKVEKILYNLLSNAIKFTPKDGEVKLICERESGLLDFPGQRYRHRYSRSRPRPDFRTIPSGKDRCAL
jgi:signal transduction histidine kinase